MFSIIFIYRCAHMLKRIHLKILIKHKLFMHCNFQLLFIIINNINQSSTLLTCILIFSIFKIYRPIFFY